MKSIEIILENSLSFSPFSSTLYDESNKSIMPLLQQFNLHQVITEKFGRNALIKYRRAESKITALAKWRNHLHFNLSCKRLGVEPKSILGPSVVKGEKADNILAQPNGNYYPFGLARPRKRSTPSRPNWPLHVATSGLPLTRKLTPPLSSSSIEERFVFSTDGVTGKN